MEKLIELLNEYVEKHNKSDLYYTFELEKDSGWLFCYDDVTDHKGWTMQDEAMVICSKRFGFIGWLVENDKIDLNEIDKKIRIYDYVEEYEEYDYVFPDSYKQLLMLLSISDTPIEDLLLYLK